MLNGTEQSQLERAFMLDRSRDPVRLALRLLGMRRSTNPYVHRRIGVWTSEVADLMDRSNIGSDGLNSVSAGQMLRAVMAASGHEVGEAGEAASATIHQGLTVIIRDQGVGAVADTFERWLHERLPAG